MTKQQLFDNTWNHHIVNREPAGFFGGLCVYRGPDGQRCGVGASITDEEIYREHITNESAPVVASALGWWQDCPEMDSFVCKLQHRHDGCAYNYTASEFHAYYEASLRTFAAIDKLMIPGGEAR